MERKNKNVESLGNKNSLIKENSLPNKLSSLQHIEFNLSFEQTLFKTKSESELHNNVIDPDFISFIENKKETISVDFDQNIFEVYDKLDAITATLIQEIDEAYLQHLVELTALLVYTPKPSTSHLDTSLLESIGSSLFTTTSSIFHHTSFHRFIFSQATFST